jgi:hypothetical protein
MVKIYFHVTGNSYHHREYAGSRQYFALLFAYDGSVTKMTRPINVVVRPGGIW